MLLRVFGGQTRVDMVLWRQRHHLTPPAAAKHNSVSIWSILLNMSISCPNAYVCVFWPLGRVLLCGRVRSLGRSSVDWVLQAVGLLFGAAGGGRLCAAGDGAAGWWGRRLCFKRRFFRMRWWWSWEIKRGHVRDQLNKCTVTLSAFP